MEKPINDPLLDEDVKLMLKVKGQDQFAFNQLVDKYQHRIINFIYRFVGNKAEAEDLAQEVFLRIYRTRTDYQPLAKFSTWIYRIAKNLALNELRRKRSQRLSSLDEKASDTEQWEKQVPDKKTSALAELEKRDLIDQVKKAIDSLPTNQKLAVILKRYDNLSYEDIAKIIGCSSSAVKSLLSRAKETLKEKLKSYVRE